VTSRQDASDSAADPVQEFRLFGPSGTTSQLSSPRASAGIQARHRRLADLADALGVAPSPAGLAQGASAPRSRHALASAEEVQTFRRRTGIGEGDLVLLAEGEWLHAMLRQTLSSAVAVQRAFARHRELFETVEAAGLPFDERAAANALLEELRAGRTRLAVEVPPDSRILPEPATSGYLGIVTRADLPPEVAEALFANSAREYVGPVPYDGRHWVYQLLQRKSADLDEQVCAYCEDLLVEEELDRYSHPAKRAP
jgi:hypothetical protein